MMGSKICWCSRQYLTPAASSSALHPWLSHKSCETLVLLVGIGHGRTLSLMSLSSPSSDLSQLYFPSISRVSFPQFHLHILSRLLPSPPSSVPPLSFIPREPAVKPRNERSLRQVECSSPSKSVGKCDWIWGSGGTQTPGYASDLGVPNLPISSAVPNLATCWEIYNCSVMYTMVTCYGICNLATYYIHLLYNTLLWHDMVIWYAVRNVALYSIWLLCST